MRAVSVAVSLFCCFLVLVITTREEATEEDILKAEAIVEKPDHFLRGDAMDTTTSEPPPPGFDLDMTQEWLDSLSKEDREEYSHLMISKDNEEWRVKHWKTKPIPASPLDVEATTTSTKATTSVERKNSKSTPQSPPPTPPPTKAPKGGRGRGRAKKSNNGNTGQGFPVDINPAANIAEDVLSITNYPQQSKVVIHLKADAKCPHPYVVGRLSGPVLVFIGGEDFAFTAPTKRDKTTKLEGHYSAPVGGQFNIELTAIYCDYFLWDQMNILKSKDWDATRDVPKLDYDLITPCTDNPWNMRLTGLGATIYVDPKQAIENPTNQNYYGYWWNKNYTQFLESKDPDSFSNFFRPLRTRFQPEGCEKGGRIENTPQCTEVDNLEQFADYEWNWTKIVSFPKWEEPGVKICYVGGSHAGHLFKFSKYLRAPTHDKILIQNVDAHYPHLATPDKFKDTGCTKLVIAQVIWPLGRVGKHHGPSYKKQKLNDYYEEVSKMLEKLKTDPITKDMELYLRSAHMSPIGYFKTLCPAHLSISTPMIDEAYNHVLRRVGQAHGVPFLSASPIVQYPMWDASGDWNHLPPMVSRHEGEFYAASVTFGLSDSISS